MPTSISMRHPPFSQHSRTAAERYGSAIIQLVKKVSSDFSAKLLSELQNQILQYDFAILPLRRVIERERTP